MTEDRLHTALPPARVMTCLQNVATVLQGKFSSGSDLSCRVTLDPYAPVETLQLLYREPGQFEELRGSVHVSVVLAASQGGTELILTSEPSIYYWVNMLTTPANVPVNESTVKAFVRTVDQTLRATERGERPPNRPPPPE